MLSKYWSLAKLAYTDTDSFIYHIQTHDLYKIWWTTCVRHVRLPSRPPPLLKTEYQGSRQDEGRMLAFGTARSCWTSSQNVQYPPPSNGKPKCIAKGVSRRYILKHLRYKDYLRTLKETESTIATFSTLRSQKQQIKTIELTKKCLSTFDDKRYIVNDGLTTLAYRHYKIAQIKPT